MTGGSLSKSTGILSRAGEIERLHTKAQSAQGEIDTAAANIRAATEELSRLSAQLTGLDADIKTISEDRIRFEGEQKRVAMALESLIEQKREAERQAQELAARLSELTKNSATSDEAIAEMEKLENELSGKLLLATTKSADFTTRLAACSQEKNEMDMERLSVEKDIEAMQSLAAQLSGRLSEEEGQSEQLSEQIKEAKRQNEQTRRAIEQRSTEIAAQKQALQALAAEIESAGGKKTALEAAATVERQRERELHQRGEVLARELAKLEERKATIQTEYDSVVSRLYDEYELTLTAAADECCPLEDIQSAARELSGIKAKIKALGSINVAAIEEYREVNERYEFMKSQIDDITRSRDELTRMINELTGDMKEIFEKSFRDINTHFGRIFVELFSGGNAKLLLTEPDNVLESGIEIYVQPPGKIIKNLAALSGGEQAFVAIAIYFAILKVRPSPFCLLDEIEAALDDINVVKYAEYLRRLIGKTQFIAITHRRGTMEAADVLYGVTMQEEGVSKLLRLDISEVESKLGIK